MDYYEILFLIAIMIMELLAPRKKFKFIREGFFEDVTYLVIILFVMPYLYNLIIPWDLDSVTTYKLIDFSNSNIFLQIIVCFILTDFLRYMLHYSFHRIPILWGIHKLHHSGKELTSLSGYRAGYWEDVCLVIFTILPMSVLKFDTKVVSGVVLFFSVYGYFLHSNLRISFPWYLRFLASPQFHHWHHAVEEIKPYGQNNGVTLTIWDIMLGSYHDTKEYPEEIGLYRGEKMEGNYVSRYFYPLTGRSKKK